MAEAAGEPRVTLAGVRARERELARIASRYGVDNIRVFGSVARGTADALSDLDLLVDVKAGTGLFALSAFALEVESLFGVPTQVATVSGLKPRVRERVIAEAVAV